MSYQVFTRTWWKENPEWPDGREPCIGHRHYHPHRFETEQEAREYCQDWNATHEAGRLSRKCEFEEV